MCALLPTQMHSLARASGTQHQDVIRRLRVSRGLCSWVPAVARELPRLCLPGPKGLLKVGGGPRHSPHSDCTAQGTAALSRGDRLLVSGLAVVRRVPGAAASASRESCPCLHCTACTLSAIPNSPGALIEQLLRVRRCRTACRAGLLAYMQLATLQNARPSTTTTSFLEDARG